MKGNYITNFKNMDIEDKILLFMEVICFILTAGTIIGIIFAISENCVIGAIILLFCIIGFISCGLSARSSRDSHIGLLKLNFKLESKKLSKLLKLD